jgi:putative ABC transport system permease protein
MGENLLTIRPGAEHRPGAPHAEGKSFTLNDAETIKSEIQGVKYVAPSSSTSQSIIYKNLNSSTPVTGTTSDYIPSKGYEIKGGRNFSEFENRGLKPLCIIGATVKTNLFPNEDPLGESIRIGKMPCTIVGVLKSKGENAMGMDQDDLVLMPIRVFQRRIAGNTDVKNISVTVAENRSTEYVKSDIEGLLRERRLIGNGKEDDFRVRDLQEIVSTIQATTSVMTTLLSAIAAVSLLVGGIGIMNIMLVSVTERTREIGIRLAIGAVRNDVRLQFLVEAAVLSGFGGIIGLIIGNGGAYAATKALNMPFIPSFTVAWVALVFSLAVGILFGILPAHRASKLDPLEALRHE